MLIYARIKVCIYTYAIFCCVAATACGFLVDDKNVVPCPNPAKNCKDEFFNRVLDNLGCLGCQTGCQPGYLMTANSKYYNPDGNVAGSYTYRNISIHYSKNVSEPQWLCLKGDTCQLGYFPSKQGDIDECAYCGEGCLHCHGYGNCNQCALGYRTHSVTHTDGSVTTECISTGVECPVPVAHCHHRSMVSQVVGCLGCVYCDPGYIPAANPGYRRAQVNVTQGFYHYKGIKVSGSLEITEPRYTCVQGPPCPNGWHNETEIGFQICEITATEAPTPPTSPTGIPTTSTVSPQVST